MSQKTIFFLDSNSKTLEDFVSSIFYGTAALVSFSHVSPPPVTMAEKLRRRKKGKRKKETRGGGVGRSFDHYLNVPSPFSFFLFFFPQVRTCNQPSSQVPPRTIVRTVMRTSPPRVWRDGDLRLISRRARDSTVVKMAFPPFTANFYFPGNYFRLLIRAQLARSHP